MSANPTFSIVVPTYNHAAYVGAALDSILAQTDRDWEAIVVNDGSTDGTAELVEDYAARDPRIRVFHKVNGGVATALNYGLKRARGQWVCWLSSDDMFDPSKLAVHREWMRRAPECRFFFTYFRFRNEAAGTTVDHDLWGPLPEPEFQIVGLFHRCYISGISICIHRQSWESVGKFDEGLRYAQDYDMWMRLLARFPGTFIPEWTCINRHHPGQGSELFPQACYYDAATATIQFLNEHRFEELFPLLDLRDTASACRAIEYALAIGADESSFLYSFGAHPALLARVLEWAWDRGVGAAVMQERSAARQLARCLLTETARRLRGTPLGWHWQAAAAAVALPDPDCSFEPIRPLEVGLGLLYHRRAEKADLAALERYFRQQYGMELPPPPSQQARREVVLCGKKGVPSPFFPNALSIAEKLQQAGCKVVVVGDGPERYRLNNCLPVLSADSQEGRETLLHRLVPADVLLRLGPGENQDGCPAWQHQLFADAAEDESAVVQQVLADTPIPYARPRRNRAANGGKRCKVVFVGRSPWGGGAERVVYDLLHAFDPARFELHFVHLFRCQRTDLQFDPAIAVHDVEGHMAGQCAPPPPPAPPVPAPLPRAALGRRIARRAARHLQELAGVPPVQPPPPQVVQQLPAILEAIQAIWPQVLALRDVLQRIGSDAVIISSMEEAAIRVWLNQVFAAQPYWVSLQTAESLYMPMLYSAPDRLMAENFLLGSACRSAAVVTMPSQGCNDDLVRHFHVPADRVVTLIDPVNVSAVLQASAGPLEVGLPPLHGKCLFIHAARLSPEKDHRLMLDACHLLKQRDPNFLVACLGEGGLRGEIQQQIAERGLENHVLLLGTVKNPFPYMARAQGLLLTSRFESFALVLIEAMACGAVPISVDCPFGPREILDGGKYGQLVPRDNSAALADAMHRVAHDHTFREAARQRGRQRAWHYDLPRVAAEWEAIVTRIAPPVAGSPGMNRVAA